MRLIKLLSLLGLPLWLTPVLAAPSLQYTISADQTYYNNQLHQATFVGHVIARRPDSTIRGDTLILYFDKTHTLQRLVCKGEPATYHMRLAHAPHRLDGTAKKINYDLVKQQTWFIGDAHVTRGNHHLSGPHLSYQLNQSTLVAKGNAHHKTHLVLQPNDVEGTS